MFPTRLSARRLPATRLMVSLPLLIVITACCIALAAGAVATWSFYAQSRRTIEANLSVLAHAKRNAVEALLTSVRDTLGGAVGNPLVQHSLDNIATSVKIMSPEQRSALRGDYASQTAPAGTRIRDLQDYYGRAYDAVHPWFRDLARELGYADILFVDRDGNVSYTLAKRADFGGNVRDAALRDTVLAEVYGQAAAAPPQSTVLSDMRPYGPAGRPVALAAAPFYEQVGARQEFLGVLVFEVPRARLDAILNDGDGFGAKGEAVLMGPDGLLRSRSRFGGPDDALNTAFTDPRILSGGPAGRIVETRGYRHAATIAATIPLANGNPPWTVVALESADEVMRPIRLMVGRIIALCLIVTVLLAWLAAALAARIARPVVALVERFDAALTNMPHGLVMVDAADHLILCNAAFATLYDLPPALTREGTPIASIEQHRRVRGMMPVDTEGAPGEREGRCALADGRTIDVVRTMLPSGGSVATHQNVTTTVRAQRQITYLATHDPLTGLLNRASLSARVSEALDRVRLGEGLAVLCLDLDHFKAVNDALGHPIGDALLKAVAGRLLECLTGRDVLARLGGDEFVILQGAVGSPDEARTLAERLIEVVAQPFDVEGHRMVIGLSVGIAVSPGDGVEADSLIKNADMALYRAKAEGRGSLRFFEAAMDAQLQARRQLELDLRQALAVEQFDLAYQPVYDAATETVTGVEALLRWRHPERGQVSPADFIPLAEEMGLIVPIGEWVIRRACRDAATWPGTARIAVNLSPIQLKSPALPGAIVAALAESGLSPGRLELEITESVLLSDDEATLATLHALKALGLRIAMDDFGTGYSSLSYLRSFPFDKLKIDQSFVRGLGGRADTLAIIKAIADLGTTLGMVTTVEGIETAEQLRLVRKQGCTEVQGYFLCRPTRSDDIGQLLATLQEQARLSA